MFLPINFLPWLIISIFTSFLYVSLLLPSLQTHLIFTSIFSFSTDTLPPTTTTNFKTYTLVSLHHWHSNRCIYCCHGHRFSYFYRTSFTTVVFWCFSLRISIKHCNFRSFYFTFLIRFELFLLLLKGPYLFYGWLSFRYILPFLHRSWQVCQEPF